MCYAPENVIKGELDFETLDENEVKNQLKKWFLASMWHDIAYMIEKGNMVLEQHITAFMRRGKRTKGLLPWFPSLGNLMQVERLLDEIREISCGAIEICDKLKENIEKNEGYEMVNRLVGDIVIAAAFERRDHGVWSAMMFNHGWDSEMSEFFPECNKDCARRTLIEDAIIDIVDPNINDKKFNTIIDEAYKIDNGTKKMLLTCAASETLLGKNHGHTTDDLKRIATEKLKKEIKKFLNADKIKQRQIELSRPLRQTIAKSIVPHHVSEWDIEAILKDYDYMEDLLAKDCVSNARVETIVKNYFHNYEPKEFKCKDNEPCSGDTVVSISQEKNMLGYLLGLCDSA